jgi:hypothetical protein
MDYATYHGAVEGMSEEYILQFLSENLFVVRQDAYPISHAARHGYIRLIKVLRDRGHCFDKHLTNDAAEGNQFETLKWLHEQGLSIGDRVCQYAAANDNMAMFDWAHAHGGSLVGAARWLAEHGRVDRFKMVCEQGIVPIFNVCVRAIRNGHLDILKIALTHNAPIYFDQAIRMAEIANQPEIAQWLRENKH